MNTHRIHRITIISCLAACLAAVSSLYGQSPAPRSAPTAQPATPEWETRALDRIAGQPVRTSSDEQISTVADFLIEPRTGDLRFAVVPSGSNTFRIVPMAAIDPAGSTEGLKLRIDRAKWGQVGTLTQDWLSGPVSMDTNHRRRLAQQFDITQPLPGDGTTVELVTASSLKGKPVQSGGDTLGTITGVAIDLQNGVAWALLNPSGGITRAGQNYLFPFDRMQIPTGGGGALTTSLTRNDLAPVQASQPGQPGQPDQSNPLRQPGQPGQPGLRPIR